MFFSARGSRPGGIMPYGPANTSIVIAGLNALVFAAIVVTGWGSSRLVPLLALTRSGTCYSATNSSSYYPNVPSAEICATVGRWQPGALDGAWWQVITSAFTHVGVAHFVFNMIALLALGPQVEALLGRVRYLIVYLAGTLGGSALVLALSPGSMTLGASGAIFGLMGALLAYVLLTKQNPSEILTWLGLNVFITVIGAGSISWQGHLGGFLGGGLAGVILVRLALKRQRHRYFGVRDSSTW